jgi:hypothetical protein
VGTELAVDYDEWQILELFFVELLNYITRQFVSSPHSHQSGVQYFEMKNFKTSSTKTTTV